MPLAVVCYLGAGTGQSHLCIASCSDDVFVCVDDEFASTKAPQRTRRKIPFLACSEIVGATAQAICRSTDESIDLKLEPLG